MEPLVRNWWLMAARGVIAMLFGLVLLLDSGLTFPLVVVLFGLYAIVDGMGALVAGVKASGRMLEGWPVAAEGVASLALGVLALSWPRVPAEFLLWLAVWGIVTGVLELIGAWRLPRELAAHWLYATGGVSSIFLAVLVLMLPRADAEGVVLVIGTYAVVFGATVTRAAILFRRRHAKARLALVT